MSLAINELCTNAVKYGALSRPDGRVKIEGRMGNATAPALFLVWEESGGRL